MATTSAATNDFYHGFLCRFGMTWSGGCDRVLPLPAPIETGFAFPRTSPAFMRWIPSFSCGLRPRIGVHPSIWNNVGALPELRRYLGRFWRGSCRREFHTPRRSSRSIPRSRVGWSFAGLARCSRRTSVSNKSYSISGWWFANSLHVCARSSHERKSPGVGSPARCPVAQATSYRAAESAFRHRVTLCASGSLVRCFSAALCASEHCVLL